MWRLQPTKTLRKGAESEARLLKNAPLTRAPRHQARAELGCALDNSRQNRVIHTQGPKRRPQRNSKADCLHHTQPERNERGS